MHFPQIERIMKAAEHAFKHELKIVEELLGCHHPRHVKRRTHLAFTEIVIHNQKIGGIIMDFTLSKDVPSVRLKVQALDENGHILPDIDTLTGHPTIKPGTLLITGDGALVIVQDSVDPSIVTVSRKDNVTSGTFSLKADASNDEDGAITGASIVTEIADPVVDTGIARSLQFVTAPDSVPVA